MIAENGQNVGDISVLLFVFTYSIISGRSSIENGKTDTALLKKWLFAYLLFYIMNRGWRIAQQSIDIMYSQAKFPVFKVQPFLWKLTMPWYDDGGSRFRS